jgi:hypothetical protein
MIRIGRVNAPWWALVAAASLVTAALAGAVVVVATPVGCKVEQRIGIHTNSARCATSPTAVVHLTPSPQLPSPVFESPTTLVPTPSFGPSPLPSHSPYPPFEYPASVPGLPPGTVITSAPLPPAIGLSCRLPIYVGPPGSGGFVAFPGGSFVADPRSGVTLPPNLGPSASPVPGPGQYGQYGQYGQSLGMTYDNVHSRWLPVQRTWVTPDFSRYAWPAQDGIYVVTVADGTVSELGSGHSWVLLELASAGAYAVVPNAGGLWLLPFTGSPREVVTTGYWQIVGSGAAYGTVLSAAPQGVANPIVRLDLATGVSTPWFMLDDGSSVTVVGFDQNGAPLIPTYDQYGAKLWLVPSLGDAKVIATYQGGQLPNQVVADAHGVWFSGGQTIYLYVPGSGWFSPSQIGGYLAGGCV